MTDLLAQSKQLSLEETVWPSEKTNLWYRSGKIRPDASSYIQHSDSSRLPKDTENRTIYPDNDQGWIIYIRQPVAESFTEKQFLLNTGQEEFEKLCSLGVFDTNSKIQGQQRTRRFMKIFFSCSRKNRTKLPLKEDHIPLPTNKTLSVARLRSTRRTLERTEKLQKYHQIMQEQGPMESWSSNHSSKREGRTLHPHQAVNRENALLIKSSYL